MRTGIFFIFVFFAVRTANAQFFWDFGGTAGATNYLGEIGGKNKPRRDFFYDMKLKQTRWDFGGFARYKLFPFLSARASLNYLRIAGADSLSTYPNRYYRNLHFRNNIVELSTQFEYNFFRANDISPRGKFRVDLNTYAFAGFGVYYHNPKAKSNIDGKWHALQPLGTEGQGKIEGIKKYSRFQLCVPLGFGVGYTIRRTYRLGLEFSYRFTFTDYLDDASSTYPDPAIFAGDPIAADLSNQSRADVPPTSSEWYNKGSIRGNPENNDTYMTAMITASYVLRGKNNFYRSKYQFQIGSKKRKRKTRAKF